MNGPLQSVSESDHRLPNLPIAWLQRMQRERGSGGREGGRRMTFAKPVSILGGVRTMMRGKNEGGGRERGESDCVQFG